MGHTKPEKKNRAGADNQPLHHCVHPRCERLYATRDVDAHSHARRSARVRDVILSPAVFARRLCGKEDGVDEQARTRIASRKGGYDKGDAGSHETVDRHQGDGAIRRGR